MVFQTALTSRLDMLVKPKVTEKPMASSTPRALSPVPNSSEVPEEEHEEEVVHPTTLSAQKERRVHIVQHLKGDQSFRLHVDPAERSSEASQSLLGATGKETDRYLLPIQPGIQDVVQRFAKAAADRSVSIKKRKYNPEKIMKTVYKLPPAQESTWGSHHQVPQDLKSLVFQNRHYYDNQTNQYVLNKTHEHGKAEKRFMAEQSRAQACLRVQNSLSLAICATQRAMLGLSEDIRSLASVVKEDANPEV